MCEDDENEGMDQEEIDIRDQWDEISNAEGWKYD